MILPVRSNSQEYFYTHDSGQAIDGNVSIGVTNLQYVLDVENLDARYVSVSTYEAIKEINDARAATGTTGVDGILNVGNVDSMNLTADTSSKKTVL